MAKDGDTDENKNKDKDSVKNNDGADDGDKDEDEYVDENGMPGPWAVRTRCSLLFPENKYLFIFLTKSEDLCILVCLINCPRSA